MNKEEDKDEVVHGTPNLGHSNHETWKMRDKSRIQPSRVNFNVEKNVEFRGKVIHLWITVIFEFIPPSSAPVRSAFGNSWSNPALRSNRSAELVAMTDCFRLDLHHLSLICFSTGCYQKEGYYCIS